MSGPKPVNYLGQAFGRLTVIGEAPRSGNHRKLLCCCTCGVKKEMFLTVLKAGTQSCGCLQRETATTHGQSRAGNPLYGVWTNMKSRCAYPKAKYFPEYGGRGFQVCPEWVASFETFQSWANTHGYVKGLTLDRDNNDQGYSPGNCRWVGRTAQQRNRRSQQGSSSQYVGVSFIQRSQQWMAGIKIAGKSICLGHYPTELEAAKARDQYIVDNSLKDFTMNGVR